MKNYEKNSCSSLKKIIIRIYIPCNGIDPTHDHLTVQH